MDIGDKARALITAEAIIGGFLFTSAGIQIGVLRDLAQEGLYPVSTFVVTLVNYALIIVTFRSVWIAFRALDQSICSQAREEWFLTSYSLFIAVLLAAIFLNVLPGMISVFKITGFHELKLVSLMCEDLSWSVGPIEWIGYSNSIQIRLWPTLTFSIVGICTLVVFLWPKWASGMLRDLWMHRWPWFLTVVALLFSLPYDLRRAFGCTEQLWWWLPDWAPLPIMLILVGLAFLMLFRDWSRERRRPSPQLSAAPDQEHQDPEFVCMYTK